VVSVNGRDVDVIDELAQLHIEVAMLRDQLARHQQALEGVAGFIYLQEQILDGERTIPVRVASPSTAHDISEILQMKRIYPERE
jgi:hypothetical protein